jgi:hypothetical protein
MTAHNGTDPWARAAARAFADEPDSAASPSGWVVPPVAAPDPPPTHLVPSLSVPLLVVDHFDLTMVDLPRCGARLLVKPLARADALVLVHRYNPPTVCLNERGQSSLERELQLEPAPRPTVRHGTRLLVMQYVKWNDIRWLLVEWECDGDGCVP